MRPFRQLTRGSCFCVRLVYLLGSGGQAGKEEVCGDGPGTSVRQKLERSLRQRGMRKVESATRSLVGAIRYRFVSTAMDTGVFVLGVRLTPVDAVRPPLAEASTCVRCVAVSCSPPSPAPSVSSFSLSAVAPPEVGCCCWFMYFVPIDLTHV